MKLLVAAPAFGIATVRECTAGELVWIPDPCPDSLRNPDGPCSCAQTFTGLDSEGLTTTAVVADLPELTPDLFRLKFWVAQALRSECTCELRAKMVDELIAHAAPLPVGTIVERRLRRILPQRMPAGA